MKTRKCLRCKKQIAGHFNRKRCRPCAKYLLSHPLGHLEKWQIAVVRQYAGKIYKKEVAKKARTSWANLTRWAKQNRVSLNAHKYKDDLVKRVCAHYSFHGNLETSKKFNLKRKQVEAIVYRYRLHHARQIRWRDSEIIEAARMAGLVSPQAQAKYFNRPNAFEGSIKSLWQKKFGMGGGSINGMVHDSAKHLVNGNARYLRPIGTTRQGKPVQFRRVVLWIDMEKNLKSGVPDFIREAISTMADFQRWLHGGGNVGLKIKRMIAERGLA